MSEAGSSIASASRMRRRGGTAGGQRVALARRSPRFYSPTLIPTHLLLCKPAGVPGRRPIRHRDPSPFGLRNGEEAGRHRFTCI